MRKRTGLLSAQAQCADCGWESFARNALPNAARHAERTGHHVTGEQVIGMSWNYRGDDE